MGFKFLKTMRLNELASMYAKEGDIMKLSNRTKLQVKKNKTSKCYYECYFNKLNQYNDSEEGQITYSCQVLTSKTLLHSIVNYFKYLRKPPRLCILPKDCHFERLKSNEEILEETVIKIKDILKGLPSEHKKYIISKITEEE